MRRVPPVQHQGVPVGIVEEGHVADARVERLAGELHTFPFELGASCSDVGYAKRQLGRIRRELPSDLGWIPDPERHLPREELGADRRVALVREAKRLAVEPFRPLDVLRRDGDEIDPLDLHYPTDPSICSWIKRFISTAYSSGSSLVIGSTKPETIIADASASDRPRLIR